MANGINSTKVKIGYLTDVGHMLSKDKVLSIMTPRSRTDEKLIVALFTDIE